MQHSRKSPLLRAPEPTPALLALQAQGFELPGYSTLNSVAELDSPNADKSPPIESPTSERRTSSTYSIDTTITNIVRFYSGVKSRTTLLNGGSTDVSPTDVTPAHGRRLRSVVYHQPKAYRDTIAPILRHQHSASSLSTPFASNQTPNNSEVNQSSSLLEVVGKSPNHSDHGLTSLKPIHTPVSPAALSFEEDSKTTQKCAHYPSQSVITLRQTSWYDEPVSPLSSDDQAGESELSPMSHNSVDYQRQLAYESLSPPVPRKSPVIEAVPVMKESPKHNPASKSLTTFDHTKMMPAPLDLSGSPSRSPRMQAAVPVSISRDQTHAGEATMNDPQPSTPDITQLQADKLSAILSIRKAEIHEGTPAEIISTKSHPGHDSLRGHVKAFLNDRKERKSLEKQAKEQQKRQKALEKQRAMYVPEYEEEKNTETLSSVMFASVEYGQVTSGKQPDQGPRISTDVVLDNVDARHSRTSLSSGPGPALSNVSDTHLHSHVDKSSNSHESVPDSEASRDIEELTANKHESAVIMYPAIPLTRYQKYGLESWGPDDRRWWQISKGKKETPKDTVPIEEDKVEDEKSEASRKHALFVKKLFQSPEQRERAKLKNSIKVVDSKGSSNLFHTDK